MAASEPRSALGGRKPPRLHPASPPASGAIAGSAELAGHDAGMVMLCVRVEPWLRRRVKLAAVASGGTIQALDRGGAGARVQASRRVGMQTAARRRGKGAKGVSRRVVLWRPLEVGRLRSGSSATATVTLRMLDCG